MESIDDWLREPARGMSPGAVLAQPLMHLQGVSATAEAALAEAGMHTVLDLAASALFGVARQVLEAAQGVGPLGGLAALPADLLDDQARTASAAAVERMGLAVLRTLEAGLAARLEQALPAPTVRDLALWPPARAARRLMQIAYGVEDVAEDPQAPSELQPRMGRQPVERVLYQHLLFEGLLPDASAPLPAPDDRLQALDAGGVEWPLDLSDALLGQGFQRPGFGARVTLAQSWTGVGLALGHLLHSVALAPGEATRVAVVDWSRRVATGSREDIAENEVLAQTLERSRALTEVTDAVASEVQRGDSRFSQTGAGWGIGAAVAGEYKGVTGAVNFGYSRNDAQGSVFSAAQGQRDVASKLAQRVQDRTEQAASLARGRRASIISEVSVQEAERLSTRVVANYNHMHALSVLYFEVVQIYRALTEVVDVEPLLYLPVRPFDFGRSELVERYRGLLAEVALNPAARDALLGIVRAPSKVAVAGPQAGLARLFLLGFAPSNPPTQFGNALDADKLREALGPAARLDGLELELHSTQAALTEIQAGSLYSPEGRPMGPALSLLTLSGPAGSETLSFKPWAQPRDRRFGLAPGESDTPYRALLANPWRRLDAMRLALAQAAAASTGAVSFELVFVFQRLDARERPTGEAVQFRASYSTVAGRNDIELLRASFVADQAAALASAAADEPPFALDKHLQANALHYSMALLRRADPALLGLMLGQLKFGGQSLLGQVDPQPLAHAGNYLVFRFGAARQADWWSSLLKERGLAPRDLATQRREALVPMPTGGVFAEAVQGRFNAAEKLDLTRFWNWQDSPIPLVPSEIAPLQAGIRTGASAPTPGSLGNANLRQQEGPALPDPSAAVVRALEIAGKGDAFRDMSGMSALLAQGGTALTLAASGAQAFMAKAMDSVSAYGARVNHGKDMDQRAAKAQGDPAAAAQPPSPGQTPAGGGSPGATGSGATGAAPAGGAKPVQGAGTPAAAPKSSNEDAAFHGPAAEAGRAAPPSGPLRQQLVVQAIESNPLNAQTLRALPVDGTLLLQGLQAPGSTGDATLTLRSGVGAAEVLRLADRRTLVQGGLKVTAVGSVALDLSRTLGTELPGSPDGWFAATVLAIQHDVNRLPLLGGLLLSSAQDGQTLELELAMPLYRPMDLRPRAVEAGLQTQFDALEDMVHDLNLFIAPNVPAPNTSLSEAQLDEVSRILRGFVQDAHRSVLAMLNQLERQAQTRIQYFPIVAMEVMEPLRTNTRVSMRMRWLGFLPPKLRQPAA